LLKKPLTWLAGKLSSAPDKKDVFSSLSQLLKQIESGKEKEGIIVPFDIASGKFIILSDQHKGARDDADDFKGADNNYMTALQYYFDHGFSFINLGDCEELWENKPDIAVAKNKAELELEYRFLEQKRYYRVFGNHDLQWKFDLPRNTWLEPSFHDALTIYEGLILRTTLNNRQYSVFLTHGHQGDKRSDGNDFSTWVVASIWTPMQRFLDINVNSISDSFELVDHHNIIMYEWSVLQKDLIFISGHTHKPVFASLDHIERLNKALAQAELQNDSTAVEKIKAELDRRKAEYAGKQFHKTMVRPTYFNSGCCCFDDGDITGIEIEGDNIRLIKWTSKGSTPHRLVLEEAPLTYILSELGA